MEKSIDKELNKLLKIAENERIKLKHPYVGSEHLFLAIIKGKSSISEYLNKYEVTYKNFKYELLNVVGQCKKENKDNLYTPLLRKIIKRYENKEIKNIEQIKEDIFVSLLDEGEGIAIRILLKMNVDLDEIYIHLKEKTKLHEMEISTKVGIILNNVVDINEKVIGREEEINKMILTLTRKKKCNPLLIGQAGVGKTALVEELTRRIIKGLIPDELKDTKIIMIEMGSLISGTKYRGEFEERLNKIIKEVINNKKVILFIDEIHSMAEAGGADGAINASDILKPYLARGTLKCIGATTIKEYNDTILKDKALARRFNLINLEEPNKEEMYDLLYKVKKEYEEYHNVKINKSIIKRIVDLSDYYLKSVSNPDKSIDLLDTVCAYARINHKDNKVCENDVYEAIKYKTNNYLLNKNEALLKIKESMKKHLPENVANKLCSCFHFENNIPISIILEDKEIYKGIIESLENVNKIEIDLNNYVFESSAHALIGDKKIEDTPFYSLIEKPFSIITFKNITSVNKCLLEEITSIIKDGYINIKYNEKLYFNSSIIVAYAKGKSSSSPGFISRNINDKLPEDFVKLFKCDLRNMHVYENNS